jgi:aminopeptidase-like protein
MSSMMDLIAELWFLKRDLVSDDFDRALYRLAQEVPMIIHEYPTGELCWTWRIPEKWTCHEAYLENMDGQRLLDYADHPLHVVSYSLPFEGVVTREELFRHLHVHPDLPEAIPFVFKYYERDWGLCASQILRKQINDEEYKVVIRTTFDPGKLKVGEVVIPGESQKVFVLAAHLCHPAMANDDLTGVMVGIEVARRLLAGPKPHYTYLLLFLPETIGSVAYLSHHEDLIPHMEAGLFLEMLGNDSSHVLQGSFQPDSQADRCLKSAFLALEPEGFIGAYRTIVPNDERQFNAPGVRVPMLSLSRVEKPSYPPVPYREYHSNLDNPTIVSGERLEASVEAVLGLLQSWESNQYVINKFKGEIFCSGYGIWIDYRVNPQGSLRLFEIMERCDGEHTIADIANELGITFQAVWQVVSQFLEKDLVWLSRQPHPTTPRRD